MYQLSPVFRADRGLVDVSVRYVRLTDAVAQANAHRREGCPVRVRAVTRSGLGGDFVGGELLVPVAQLRRAA
jgi:hypothetical protein